MVITQAMADAVIYGALPDSVLADFDVCVDQWVGKDCHITEYGSDCRAVWYRFFARLGAVDIVYVKNRLAELKEAHLANLEDDPNPATKVLGNAWIEFFDDLQVVVSKIEQHMEGSRIMLAWMFEEQHPVPTKAG